MTYDIMLIVLAMILGATIATMYEKNTTPDTVSAMNPTVSIECKMIN